MDSDDGGIPVGSTVSFIVILAVLLLAGLTYLFCLCLHNTKAGHRIMYCLGYRPREEQPSELSLIQPFKEALPTPMRNSVPQPIWDEQGVPIPKWQNPPAAYRLMIKRYDEAVARISVAEEAEDIYVEGKVQIEQSRKKVALEVTEELQKEKNQKNTSFTKPDSIQEHEVYKYSGFVKELHDASPWAFREIFGERIMVNAPETGGMVLRRKSGAANSNEIPEEDVDRQEKAAKSAKRKSILKSRRKASTLSKTPMDMDRHATREDGSYLNTNVLLKREAQRKGSTTSGCRA